MFCGTDPAVGGDVLKSKLNALGVLLLPTEIKFHPEVIWNDVEVKAAPDGSCAVKAVWALTQKPSPALIVVSTS